MSRLAPLVEWIVELAVAIAIIVLVLPPLGAWLVDHGWFGRSAVERPEPAPAAK